MTAQELFGSPAALFSLASLDVERAKVMWCAQFVHVGCGGKPVAYNEQGQLGCSGCTMTWPAAGSLGRNIEATKAFRCMIVEGEEA